MSTRVGLALLAALLACVLAIILAVVYYRCAGGASGGGGGGPLCNPPCPPLYTCVSGGCKPPPEACDPPCPPGFICSSGRCGPPPACAPFPPETVQVQQLGIVAALAPLAQSLQGLQSASLPSESECLQLFLQHFDADIQALQGDFAGLRAAAVLGPMQVWADDGAGIVAAAGPLAARAAAVLGAFSQNYDQWAHACGHQVADQLRSLLYNLAAGGSAAAAQAAALAASIQKWKQAA